MTKMLNVSELKMKREGNMTNCLLQRFHFKLKFTLPQKERKSIRFFCGKVNFNLKWNHCKRQFVIFPFFKSINTFQNVSELKMKREGNMTGKLQPQEIDQYFSILIKISQVKSTVLLSQVLVPCKKL